MTDGRLSEQARSVLDQRLRFCEAQHLDEGAAYFRAALENWNQAEYEAWIRIDDLAGHPKDKAELKEFCHPTAATGSSLRPRSPNA